MLFGEVLGKLDCTNKNKEVLDFGLKVVRLYQGGMPGKVIVAKDAGTSHGNGDFVELSETNSSDYIITGFADVFLSPCGVRNK